MLKAYHRILIFASLVLPLVACSPPTEIGDEKIIQREVALQSTIQALEDELTGSEISPMETSQPYEGFWVSESDDLARSAQILVITEDHFYRLQTYDPLAPNLPMSAREMYAEIISVNPEMGHMVLRIQWLRTDGQFGGFNYPTVTVTYSVEGDILRIATMQIDDTQFPDEPDQEPYFRR